MFKSVRRRSLDNERLEIALEAWQYVTSVQLHFSDMEMRVRHLYFTILTAALGLTGVVQGRKIELFDIHARVSLSLFVIVATIPVSMMFYFIDRYWYHQLLEGAIKQGMAIEERYKKELPEIQLGSRISAESPLRFGNLWLWRLVFFFVRDSRFRKKGELHSDQKIEVLYKSAIFGALFIAILYSIFNGVLIGGCTLIPYFAGRPCVVHLHHVHDVESGLILASSSSIQ